MDSNAFSRFDNPTYSLKIHRHRQLNLLFQKLWLPFILLAFLFILVIIASIIIAGDPAYVVELIRQLFTGYYDYCNTTVRHAAACLTGIGFVLIIPFLLVLAWIAQLLVRISRDIPHALAELGGNGRLKPKDLTQFTEIQAPSENLDENSNTQQNNYWERFKGELRLRPHSPHTFSEDLENALLSPWRYPVFIFWTVVVFALVLTLAKEVGVQNADLPVLWLSGLAFVTIFPIFVAYFFTAWSWFFFVIGYYLRWIPKMFDLDIQPRHGDRCGGLKKFGDISFKVAFTITLPAILVGIWGVSGVITLVSAKIPSIALVVFVLVIILLALAVLAFFQPLLEFHNEMSNAKDRYYNHAVAERLAIESRLRHLYSQGEYESPECLEQLNRLKILQILYPADMKYPTWPIDTATLLAFITTQILPVLGAVIAIIEFLG